MDKGQALRALHAGPGAFVIPNPWDIGTAKFLQNLGFPALATTSAGFAFSRGLKDGAVGFEAMIQHCRELAGAVEVPVSADLEKGKGDSPESAGETVFAADAAGLAGCSIEDNSGDQARPIYEFSHALERVSAAVGAARALKTDFVFTARAENFLCGRPDLDDTIRRLQAFDEAGADVLYAPGLTTLDQVRAICSAVSKPVNVLAIPGFTVASLSEAGARRISLGSKLSTYAFAMVKRAAEEIRANGSFEFARDGMPFAELQGMF